MILLDASVLIAYLDGADAHHDAAHALIAGLMDENLGINPVTLAEVLVGPTRAGRLDDALAVLRDLEVESLPFPSDAAVRLARLRASTTLKLPDCCVLLAAEDAGAQVASFDARLIAAATSRGLSVV